MDRKSQPSLPDQPTPERDALPPGATPAGAPPEWDAMSPAAWAPAPLLAPAPAPAKSRRRGRFAIIAICAAVIVIAGLFVVVTLRSPAGNVYFSRTAYDTSSGTCQFDSPVTTVSTSDPVFLVAVFSDGMQVRDNYTLKILKDGVSVGTTNAAADAKFSCYVEQTSLGPLSAGVYIFTFKHDDKIEAEGTLTVK